LLEPTNILLNWLRSLRSLLTKSEMQFWIASNIFIETRLSLERIASLVMSLSLPTIRLTNAKIVMLSFVLTVIFYYTNHYKFVQLVKEWKPWIKHQ
jgi:hypothetical protein